MNILEFITFCTVKGLNVTQHELRNTNPVLRTIPTEDRKFFHTLIESDDAAVTIVYATDGEILQTTLNYNDPSDGKCLFTGAGMDKIQEVLLGQ